MLLFLLLVFGLGGRCASERTAEVLVEPADALGDAVVARFEPVAGGVEHAAGGRAAAEERDGNGQREKSAFQDETPSETRTNRRCLSYISRPAPRQTGIFLLTERFLENIRAGDGESCERHAVSYAAILGHSVGFLGIDFQGLYFFSLLLFFPDKL